MVRPFTQTRFLLGLLALGLDVGCARAGYYELVDVFGDDVDRTCSTGSSGLCVDAGFGADGVFTRDVGGLDNVEYAPQGLDIDTADRLLLAGIGGSTANLDFIVVRVRDDGSVDSTFGQEGVAQIDTGFVSDHAESVRVQADGKIVVAGICDDTGCVVRLTAGGSLDPSFNSTGIRVVDSAPGWEVINAQVILADGRMRFCGQGATTIGGAPTDFYLSGLLANGLTDLGFGNSGVMSVDIAGADEFGGMLTLDANERILATGNGAASASFDFVLARIGANGTIDTTFNNGLNVPGRVALDFFGRADSCGMAVAQPDGRVVCGGSATDTADVPLFAVARYLASGALDTSFAGVGFTTLNLHGGISSVVVLSDGRLLLGGSATNANGDNDFALAMLHPDGALDPSFGIDGTALIDITPGKDDGVHAMMLDRRGRLVAMGHTSNGVNNDLAVVRIWL